MEYAIANPFPELFPIALLQFAGNRSHPLKIRPEDDCIFHCF